MQTESLGPNFYSKNCKFVIESALFIFCTSTDFEVFPPKGNVPLPHQLDSSCLIIVTRELKDLFKGKYRQIMRSAVSLM